MQTANKRLSIDEHAPKTTFNYSAYDDGDPEAEDDVGDDDDVGGSTTTIEYHDYRDDHDGEEVTAIPYVRLHID